MNNASGSLLSGAASSITAGATANNGGTIAATGPLTLATAGLDNTGGTVNSGRTLQAATQALINQGGLIQSAGAMNVNTQGQSLDNTHSGSAGGIIAGTTLSMQTGNLDNSAGTIASYGDQTLTASGAFTNSGTLYSAGQLQVNAAGIADTSGTITATGPLSLQAQTLTLTGTTIQSGSTTALAATAGALQTANTTLTSAGDLTASAIGAVSNQSGNWQSGGNIALNGTSIDNTGGIVHSGGTLNAATPGILTNTAGQLLAGGNATINSVSLINDHGQIASNQTTSVTAAGGISNQSGIISGVTGLAMNAGAASLNNAAGALLSGGASTLTAGNTSNAAGTIAATGPLTITTARFDNTGGTVDSGSTLQAATQALINQGGLIQSAGAMSVNTQGQSLDNTHSGSTGGIVSGGTLSMQTGNLDNSAGTIASYGDQTLTASGAFTNSGTLYSAGQLQVNAASIADTSGTITATGPLSLQAQSLNLAGTTIQSGGTTALTASAGGLQTVNTQLSSTGDLTATATGALSNQSGNWQSAGNIALNGTSIDNTSGIIHSSGTLNATTPGILTNSGGQLLAGGNATVNSASLINDHGQIASNQSTSVTATGGISNQSGIVSGVTGLAVNAGSANLNNASGSLLSGAASSITAGATANNGGTIAATGPLTLVTAQLDNTGGTIASTAGNLTVTTQGQSLINNNGHIQSAATAALSTGALSNLGGVISANALTLATGSVDNTAGAMVAATTLQAATQAIVNTGGLIQGGSGVAVNTQGQTLSNTQSGNTGGIVSGGSLTLQSGALDNTGGYLASNGNQTIATQGDFTNSGGTMTALGGLNATVAGNLNNQSGSMAANQDVNLSSNTLSNTTAQGANHAGSIAGRDVSLVAGIVTNQGGSIQSAVDTVVTTSNFDNTGGTASAGQNLTVAAAQLTNTGGSLVGNNTVTVNTASAAPAGTIASAGTVNINDSGAYLNSGLLSAQNDLNITASGITNNAGATLTAGHNLTATTAGDLNNAGEISAANNTVLNVGGTLTNNGNGLINSDNLTGVNAATLNNTAHIYGNWVALATTTANNTGPGVIAARNGLQLAAQMLNNTANAQILSLGDLTMAGSFDPYGSVVSPMASLLNASSTIQAQGNVNLQVNNLTNRNDGLVIGTQTATVPIYIVQGNTTLTSQTTVTSVVQQTDPARIIAGNFLTVSGSGASSVINANSALVAGGALSITAGALTNISASGTQTIIQSGQTAFPIIDQCSWYQSCGSYIAGYTYQPYSTSSSTSIPLNTVMVVANSNTAAPAMPYSVASAPATASASTPASTPVALSHTPALGQVLHATAIAAQTLAANPAAIAHIPASGPLSQNAVAIANPSSLNSLAHAPPTLQQVTVPGSGTQASLVISTMLPSLVAPANELFTILPAPNANYLVETDPAFTNQQNFLSSNYFLQKLNMDPSRELKRYGDGFYEQQLINQQVMGLTGRAYLGDYTSTQAEYQALMNAGVTYAKDFDLTPGITLSAAEMAKMTTDMVWMTTKTVTLADGTTQQVLVPQVYLAHAPGQDMTNGGSLISGANVAINTAQTLTNSGTIQGTSISATAGNDLVNQNGVIRGNQVLLSAGNDLSNLSGTIAGMGVNSQVDLLAGRDINLQTQTLSSSTAMSNRTSLGNLATVQAGNINLQAGRDLTVEGAQVSAAQDIQALAGRDINVGAITTTFNLDSSRQTGDTNNYLRQSSTTQNGSSLAAGGNVILATAGGNASLTASSVTASHDLQIAARNVTVQAGVNSRSNEYRTGGKDYLNHTASATQSLTGGVLSAGNNLAIQATGTPNQTGTGDIALNAAQLAAQNGQIDLQAAHDISLGTVDTSQSSYSHTYSKSSGFLSSSSTTDINSSSATTANGSNVSGNTVYLNANHDLTLNAAQLSAQNGITAQAGGNINILAAQNTESQQHDHASSKSGLSISGYQKNSQQISDTLNSTTQTGSRLTTQNGNVVLVANLNQNTDPTTGIVALDGSHITAATGQVLIGAKHILIGASGNQSSSTHTSKDSKSTVSVLTGLPSGKQLNDVASAQQTTLNRSTINGATGITLTAQGLVNVDASQLAAAQGDIRITGANVNLQSDLNSRSASDHATQSNTGVSWQDLTGTFRPGQGQNYKAGTTTNNADSTLVSTTLNAQNIDIQSTAGDITLGAIQATEHGSRNADGTQTPGSIDLTAAHNLNFTTIQTTRQQSTDITQSDIAWQVKKGGGTVDQTTHYTELNAQTLGMTAAHRITADMSVKDSAAVLAQEPGMSWIQPLLHDPKLSSKVDWNQIQEMHQHWDYRAQGLTPAAAAVITIVVAYFTAGSGAEIMGGGEAAAGASAAGTTAATTATLTAGEAATAAAISTGITAISSQTAISLIDNGGDVGATLKQLGSSQSIRNIATAMLTAGAVSEVANLANLSTVTAQSSFAANAELGIVRGVTAAVVNSAINGTSLESNLRTDITAGLLSAVSAKGANWIGDEAQNNNLNGFSHILAHAVAGCAVGTVSGGSAGRGCGAGALGASVGEMAAQFYGAADPQSTIAFARMISGIAAAVAGEDATGIAIASTAGANAAQNNYILHITQITSLESACHANSPGACGLVNSVDHSQSQLTNEHKGVWQIVKDVDVNGNVVAYSAYNTSTNHVDFVMNPNDLPGFLATNTGTLLQQNSLYYHAPSYVVSGGLAAESVQNGDVGLGLSLAAQSWGQALTDPGWLSSMVGGLAGGSLAAGEVAGANSIVQLETRSAAATNEAMVAAGNQPAWLANTDVVKQVVPTGTQYNMVVSEAQAQALARGESWFGNWATTDAVPSQAFARNNLSILPEFKPDVSYLATIETTAPQTLNSGFAGPLGGYNGTAAQVEFLGPKNLTLIGNPQLLPAK
ncbi:MAG: hemagglutinin repeat-containing protein [Burkholderiales bacterium]